jgi:hypothetical protein
MLSLLNTFIYRVYKSIQNKKRDAGMASRFQRMMIVITDSVSAIGFYQKLEGQITLPCGRNL